MRHVFVVRKIDRTKPDLPEVWEYETRADAEAKLEALTFELFGEGVIELHHLSRRARPRGGSGEAIRFLKSAARAYGGWGS
jgi:hypothetical protein